MVCQCVYMHVCVCVCVCVYLCDIKRKREIHEYKTAHNYLKKKRHKIYVHQPGTNILN